MDGDSQSRQLHQRTNAGHWNEPEQKRLASLQPNTYALDEFSSDLATFSDDFGARKQSKTKVKWFQRTHLISERRRVPGRRGWRFGLYAGLYASIAVLLSNITLLFVAIFAQDGVINGIGTIAKGDMGKITRLSTAYHVFINILSTILLTSSNYAMQIICAPTRNEIDRAHGNGNWLEIGIMSLRNLRRIDRKRVLLWAILAFTSAPLHLFYNSSVFEVIAGQDFSVTLIANTSELLPASTAWKKMENSDWTRTYSTSWVPGYGDLLLVVDKASFAISIHQNWSYSLSIPDSADMSCAWKPTALDKTVWEVTVSHNLKSGTVQPQLPIAPQNLRVVSDISQRSNDTPTFPELEWPRPRTIETHGTGTLKDQISLCEEGGWLLPGTAFHVQYAHAKVIPYANRVQVAIIFLAIVVACNMAKIIGIYLTIRMCSSGHIITVGDAVASFLESPEPLTKGKCILKKPKQFSSAVDIKTKPWCSRKRPMMFILGGTRVWSAIIIIASASLIITSLSAATSGTIKASSWGTASKSIIAFTTTDFDARGALLIAFLANLPQVCLSLLYFSVNRICTSVCLATEWNNYAINRKGLRVTSPSEKQRDTYFLQLPYRWAIPLTVTSGMLHWLLSQSLFLVRRELRKQDGSLYPESICACGYSILSLLIFTLVFFALFIVLLYLLLKHIDVRIPPARHCSMIISAACHPPEGDIEPQLTEVQWGVTEEGSESKIGHCTFTSHPVMNLQPGFLYA